MVVDKLGRVFRSCRMNRRYTGGRVARDSTRVGPLVSRSHAKFTNLNELGLRRDFSSVKYAVNNLRRRPISHDFYRLGFTGPHYTAAFSDQLRLTIYHLLSPSCFLSLCPRYRASRVKAPSYRKFNQKLEIYMHYNLLSRRKISLLLSSLPRSHVAAVIVVNVIRSMSPSSLRTNKDEGSAG
ncbi:hypothetical protein PUN28_017336 [Cardiocondyla obscurior]|uniref:Uncharacterized protein n=1 Tax=Cardiocondyla obscurior TaxID=286306 RepID=A0AAW2EQ36_9HYME